jgi:hypothetical protein
MINDVNTYVELKYDVFYEGTTIYKVKKIEGNRVYLVYKDHPWRWVDKSLIKRWLKK